MNLDNLGLPVEARIEIFEILKKHATQEQLKSRTMGFDPRSIPAEDKIAIVKIIEKYIDSNVLAEAGEEGFNSIWKHIEFMSLMMESEKKIPDKLAADLEKTYNVCARFVRAYNTIKMDS